MERKSAPFSIRLSASTDRIVSEEARRTRRSKGAVVETLTEEAIRCRRFPGIAFRGEDWNRRAWLIGTALDVWQVVDAYGDFGSVERMVAETDLDERRLRIALAYWGRYPEEIDSAVRENRRPLSELAEEHPDAEIHRIGS